MISDYEAIKAARATADESVLSADITNLPPGYIEGFAPSIDSSYHVTFSAGSTSVEGRQVTIGASHQIVDEDFVGSRLGSWFYYVYLDSSGVFKVDRSAPVYSDQYVYYAHPLFAWRAIGKLWVDSADNNIKYVTQDITGVSTIVTVAAYNASEIVSADYKCTGTNDEVFIQMAIDFLSGAYSGGQVRLTRGQYNWVGDITVKSGLSIVGEGESTYLYTDSTALARITVIGTVSSYLENVLLKDFRIEVSSNYSNGICVASNYVNNLTMNNIHAICGGRYGLSLGIGSKCVITNCEIEGLNNTSGDACCIFVGADNATISNNYIHDCTDGSAIYSFGAATANNNLISNNLITNLTSGNGVTLGGSATASDYNLIIGNHIYNSSGGISVGSATTGNSIVGNYTSSVTGAFGDAGTDTLVVSNSWQLDTTNNEIDYPHGATFVGGNLGVGTNGPNALVDLDRTAVTVTDRTTYHLKMAVSDTDVLTLGADASYAYIQSWNNQPLVINNQGNNIILGDGSPALDVGIGTTGPNAQLDNLGDTRLGDSTTNYVEVEADGDVNFVGGGGMQFGEMYTTNNSTATTFAASTTFYQLTIFSANGSSNGSVTPDHTNDHITVGKAGMYLCVLSASAYSGAGAAYTIEGHIETNNGATSHDQVHFDRYFAGGGSDVASISASGILDLAANDTVEVWVQNLTNTTSVVFQDINLTLTQIGGT